MKRKKIVIYGLIIFLGIPSLLCAQEEPPSKFGFSTGRLLVDEKDLNTVQTQARVYRQQGIEEQGHGNLEAAMVFYQKAIAMDSSYAVPYNDLGVIYETYGWLDRAEESYKKAISIDSNFLSAYSNLALLYENKKDFKSAYYYWKMRVDLGSECDPWTNKAKERIDKLVQFLPEVKQLKINEEKRKLAEITIMEKEEKIEAAKREFIQARSLFHREKYKDALASVELALFLNPQDKDALELKDEVSAVLKKINKEADIKNMQEYFRNGTQFYRQDDLQAAEREFERIVELTALPQKI